LSRLQRWLEKENGKELTLGDLCPDHLDSFRRHLTAGGYLRPGTVRQMLHVADRFVTWAREERGSA
jgi:hypothetical protein